MSCVSLFVCPFVCFSVRLSVRLCLCPSVRSSVSVCLSVILFQRLTVMISERVRSWRFLSAFPSAKSNTNRIHVKITEHDEMIKKLKRLFRVFFTIFYCNMAMTQQQGLKQWKTWWTQFVFIVIKCSRIVHISSGVESNPNVLVSVFTIKWTILCHRFFVIKNACSISSVRAVFRCAVASL